ncbi:MAG: enoyl-CoA hydratase-related protein [Acidimicrobiales bacterium]
MGAVRGRRVHARQGSSWFSLFAGVARAKDMLLLGRKVSGLEAAEWGLVHQAVEGRALDTVAGDLVAELAAAPTVALADCC